MKQETANNTDITKVLIAVVTSLPS